MFDESPLGPPHDRIIEIAGRQPHGGGIRPRADCVLTADMVPPGVGQTLLTAQGVLRVVLFGTEGDQVDRAWRDHLALWCDADRSVRSSLASDSNLPVVVAGGASYGDPALDYAVTQLDAPLVALLALCGPGPQPLPTPNQLVLRFLDGEAFAMAVGLLAPIAGLIC